MMLLKELQESINMLVNRALANVNSNPGSDATQTITQAAIATALTNAGTAVTALAGSATTHDRTITDPGAALNPSQP